MSALGILSGLAKAACVIEEIYNTYKQIETLQNNAGVGPNDLPPNMRKAAIVTKVSVICLTTVDVIGSAFGLASSNTLSGIKSLEVTARVLHVPIRVYETSKELKQQDSMFDTLRKGLLIPVLGIARAMQEKGIYSEKSYLELSPEEFAKTKRPIYELDEEGRQQIVDYKDLDVKECHQLIEFHEKVRASALVCEVVARRIDKC